MRSFTALAIAGSVFAASAQAATRYIDVDLVADSVKPKPGNAAFIGLRMVPKAGWHSYWSNPGEAGFPTTIKWSAPAGVHFGTLRHPAPTLLRVAGLTSYVHAGPHILLSRVTLDRDIPPGTSLPITADVSWAACSDKLCVPQKATLALELTAGNGERSEVASLIHRALANEPKNAGPGSFEVEDDLVTIELPAGIHLESARAKFFPDENGTFDAARQRAIGGSPWQITAPMTGAAPKVLSGVVSDGSRAYRVAFERKALAKAQATTKRAEAPDLSKDSPHADPVPAIADGAATNAAPAKAKTPGRSRWPWVASGLGALAILFVLAMARYRRSAA